MTSYITAVTVFAHLLLSSMVMAQTVSDNSSKALTNVELASVHRLVTDTFFDADAAKYQKLRRVTATVYCGEINGKNRYVAYVGFLPFWADLAIDKSMIQPDQTLSRLAFDKAYVSAGCSGDAPAATLDADATIVKLKGSIAGGIYHCDRPEPTSAYGPAPGCTQTPVQDQELPITIFAYHEGVVQIKIEGATRYALVDHVAADCHGLLISMKSWVLQSIPEGHKPCW